MRYITRTYKVAKCLVTAFNPETSSLVEEVIECFWRKSGFELSQEVGKVCDARGLKFLKMMNSDVKIVKVSLSEEEFYEMGKKEVK